MPALRFIEQDPSQIFSPDTLLLGEQIVDQGFEDAGLDAWRRIPCRQGGEGTAPAPDHARAEGGIELPAPQGRLCLERSVDLDAAEIDLIGLVVNNRRRSARELVEWQAVLSWSTEDLAQPAPELEKHAVAVASSPDEMLLRLQLAGHVGWQGRIRRLRLNLRSGPHTRPGTLQRIYAASAILDQERLEALAREGCKIQVGPTVRSSLPALPDLPIERRLRIPPESELRFTYAVPDSLAGHYRFRVLVTGDSKPEVVFDREVPTGEAGRWHRAQVDLRRFAGHQATLRLEVDNDSPTSPLSGFPVWGHPEVLAFGPPPSPRRFNIVLVSLDTLRADHLGLYGYPRETSPNLDAMARDSVVFDRAIAQAPSTYSSHRSLFRSRYVSQLDDATPVLPALLRDAGYQTAAFTAAGNVSSRFGFAAGFDLYAEHREGFSKSFDELEDWLRQTAREPFFVFVHTYDIHTPYNPPPPFDDLFSPDYKGPVEGRISGKLATAARARINAGGTPRQLDAYRKFEEMLPLSDADRQRMIALYDGGVRYTDQYAGRVIALLSDLSLLSSTAVVFFADHGEEFWDHGSLLHSHSLYQELIRVPLILRLPAARSGGSRIRDTVRLMDLAPTLLALAGQPPPASFQGRSLLPLAAGKPLEEVAAISERDLQKSVLRYPWKLIQHPKASRTMLFDLRNDPGELDNLRAQRPDVVEKLSAEIDRLLAGKSGRVDEEPTASQDAELREQLRALGYID